MLSVPSRWTTALVRGVNGRIGAATVADRKALQKQAKPNEKHQRRFL